jgi:hypothetical protein
MNSFRTIILEEQFLKLKWGSLYVIKDDVISEMSDVELACLMEKEIWLM